MASCVSDRPPKARQGGELAGNHGGRAWPSLTGRAGAGRCAHRRRGHRSDPWPELTPTSPAATPSRASVRRRSDQSRPLASRGRPDPARVDAARRISRMAPRRDPPHWSGDRVTPHRAIEFWQDRELPPARASPLRSGPEAVCWSSSLLYPLRHEQPAHRTWPAAPITARLNRRAAYASIAVALLLLGMKAYAVISTGSTAMLGSLADTGLDLIASLATLLGVCDRGAAGRMPKTTASATARRNRWRRCSRWRRSLSALGIGARRSNPSGRDSSGRSGTGAFRFGHCHGRNVCAAGLSAPRDPRHRQPRDHNRQRALSVRPPLNLAVIAALALDHRLGLAGRCRICLRHCSTARLVWGIAGRD